MHKKYGYRQVVLAAIVIGCVDVGCAYAVTEVSCSANQTEISGLKFTPGSLVFHDTNDVNYVAANIIIPESEFFSATFRTQLIKRISKQGMDFSGLNGHSITPVLTKPDRYGRSVVNLFAKENQRWLQWELVNAGLVMVNPQGLDLNCIRQLLGAESTARSKRIGIWQFPEVVMSYEDVNWKKRIQSYQLVEGVISSVGKTNSKYYLNFGDNWNEDFTVIVAKPNFKRFKKVYGELKQLAGKKVRVRGWMIENRGPMIEIYHPGQIEIDIE